MSDDDILEFELRPNGPILVRNLKQMGRPDGTTEETKPAIAVCRCGESANKPFCDGTHKDCGFDDGVSGEGGHDGTKPSIQFRVKPNQSPAVVAFDGGPLAVHGEMHPDESGLSKPEKDSFFLCRCGQSTNKPFCDGTHKECGFEG